MSICVIKNSSELGIDFILTPERYNPNRRMSSENTRGILLSDIVTLSSDIVSSNEKAKYIQINTSDAVEGYLNIPKEPTELGSNKKMLKTGDVIISRLRPYLKQIAFVDSHELKNPLVASTEFYVLRSKSKKSIAFLVPFLLSEKAQSIFINSVEGSQHPRFKEEDLLNLIVPTSVLDDSESISQKVEHAIEKHRSYEKELSDLIQTVNSEM